MSGWNKLPKVMQLNVNSFALIMRHDSFFFGHWRRFEFSFLFLWNIKFLFFSFFGLHVVLLMNFGYDVFIGRGVHPHLKIIVFIFWITQSHTKHNIRDTLQPRNVSHIHVSFGGTHVDWQFKYPSIQFVVDIKEIQDSPPITYVFIRRCCIWLWHLQFND